MKLFFLFAVAVTMLLAANPSKPGSKTGKKDNEPACCDKTKCIENEVKEEPDDISLFQFSPFNI